MLTKPGKTASAFRTAVCDYTVITEIKERAANACDADAKSRVSGYIEYLLLYVVASAQYSLTFRSKYHRKSYCSNR